MALRPSGRSPGPCLVLPVFPLVIPLRPEGRSPMGKAFVGELCIVHYAL